MGRFWLRQLTIAAALSLLAFAGISAPAFAATLTVDSTADGTPTIGAPCTLREALTNITVNVNVFTECGAPSGGPDTIQFAIGATGSSQTINLAKSQGPLFIPSPTIIDGWSQGGVGYTGPPLIELNGAALNAGQTAILITTATASGSKLQGLAINRAPSAGVTIINASNVSLYGNYIGTDPSGTTAQGNGTFGVTVSGPSSAVTGTVIGGTGAGEGNVISGNGVSTLAAGISLATNVSNSTVVGNIIGLSADGTSALANTGNGIFLSDAASTTIGGTTSAARNVISANTQAGIAALGATTTDLKIQGNRIGTNAAGTAGLGNALDGVSIGQATGALVGGPNSGEGNLISGNLGSGVTLYLSANSATIQGNLIGTNASSNPTLGNLRHGVDIDGTSGAVTGATVGGTTAAEANTIAGNIMVGVSVHGAGTTGNIIRRNSIFSNTGLGIDLGEDGVTANDSGDGDTGANTLQNFPVVSSVTVGGGSASVAGTLNSTASASFVVELFSNGTTCDTSGNGEGKTFLGTANVNTDGTGNGTFNTSVTGVSVGDIITATATGTGGTSEFSACATAQSPSIIVDPTSGLTTTEAGGTATFTVKLGTIPSSTVTVTLSTSDATEGTVSPTTLTFQPDATALNTQTVTITGQDDPLQDGNIAYTITTNAATSADPAYNGIDPDNVSVTNADDDTAGAITFSVAGVQVKEIDGTVTLTVTRNGGASGVTVDVATANGTATAGQDYTTVTTTLSFALGETSKTVTVPILTDDANEGDETFTATLSNPTGGATLGAIPTTVVTIIDGTVGTVQQVNDDDSSKRNGRESKDDKETEDEQRQRERTNTGNRDDIATEGNVIEVHQDENPPYVVIANRDGPVVVQLLCGDQCPTIRVGDYIEVSGTKEHEQLFYAEDVSVSRR